MTQSNQSSQRNWYALVVFTLFFWWLGADRFYMGKPGTAILKIVTFGGCGWWALYDWMLVFTNTMKDNNGQVAAR